MKEKNYSQILENRKKAELYNESLKLVLKNNSDQKYNDIKFGDDEFVDEINVLLNEKYSIKNVGLTDADYKLINDLLNDISVKFEESLKIKCDKFDYLIAISSGIVSALIDIYGIGKKGPVNNYIDKTTDKFVEKIAKVNGWDGKPENPIKYLEEKFKVNYDQRHSGDVGNTFNMSPNNHHLKSLSHSPSPIGLIFSIINQFNSTSSFISEGKIVTISTDSLELKGNDIISKIYCGAINWFMHLVSDVAGSSQAIGRGSGIPIPFYELFLFLDFVKFGKEQTNIANMAIKVFEQGYDLRHGAAMSIPVVINELLVRFLWSLKLYLYENVPIKEIVNLDEKNKLKLKRIYFNSYGCFCLLDAGSAYIKSASNPEPATKIATMLYNMNLVAWLRFGKLGLDEIIRQIKIDSNKERDRHKFIMNKLNSEYDELISNTTLKG